MNLEELKKENEELKNELKMYKLEIENKKMRIKLESKDFKIISIIKENGNKISKKELLIKLQDLYKEEKWMMGIGKTLNYLNELIKDGVIKEKAGEKKNVVIYV